ncbi:MAG: hypothetical protein Q4G67_04080 [Actinomycetia bacterium]|nr:hypothetical protein [Actinomycetes bacterium]
MGTNSMDMDSKGPSSARAHTGAAPGTRIVRLAFYGGLILLLLLIVTTLLGAVLPASLTSKVSYNSEAYLFAVVLGAWIQFVLPRLDDSLRMRWAVAAAMVSGAVGIGLVLSDLPSRIRTLNETCMALSVLIPYVTLRRPLPRSVVAIVPGLLLLTAWAVVWDPDGLIVDQAESVGFIVLAVLTFDVFDRTLLDPQAPVRRGLRAAWYAFMVLEPVVVSALGTEIRGGDGPVALTLRWLGRIHESFVGLLLVALIIHLTRYLQNRARSDQS